MPPTMRVVFGFEPVESCLRDFYAYLVNCVQLPEMHDGGWSLLNWPNSLGRQLHLGLFLLFRVAMSWFTTGLTWTFRSGDITFLK